MCKNKVLIFISLIFLFFYGCANTDLTTVLEEDSQGSISTERYEYAAPSWPVVKKGDNSLNTKTIQYFLSYRGYSVTIDGIFGTGTENAVKSFQSANGLVSDGIVGQATWTKLVVQVQYGNNNLAVKCLQDLLKNKFGYSLTIDGIYGNGTKTAVLDFKNRRGLTGADVVGVTTWQYIIGESTDFWSSRVSSWVFPVKGSGVLDIYSGSRYFGASRDGGARAHAGVDLVPVNGPGTEVIAMTSGTVLNYYLFYAGTYALEVKNDDGTIARYCEISSSLRAGARVSKGQVIGKIIRNTSGGSYMLHLEMYMGTSTGSLTNSSNTTYYYVPYKNYQRRSDLLDPMGVIKLPKL